MASITGIKELNLNLAKREFQAKRESGAAVIVGYTANYAVWVHEARMKLKGQPRSKGRGRFWDPQGRARNKYLEEPARVLAGNGTLSRIVATAYKRSGSLIAGLMMAGMRLQAESQKIVPVDTGNLKNSAFTRLEK